MPQDHHKTLGISRSANLEEIKQAVHAKSKEIKRAFAVLSDTEKRRIYDSKLDSDQHSHYTTLAVSRKANSAEIKRAAQARLNELKDAYENLSNLVKRKTDDTQSQSVKSSVPHSLPIPSQSKTENIVLQQKSVLPSDHDKPQIPVQQPLPPMRKHCSACNAIIHLKAGICPECKTRQPVPDSERDKSQHSSYRPPLVAILNPYEEIKINTELAGLGKRLITFILDGIIFLMTFGIFSRNQTLGVFIFILLLLVNWVLLYRRGQTISKRLLSIKIVKTDGDRAELLRLFVRSLVSVPGSIIPIVIGLNAFLIFGESQRCLHDTIAGTIVVKVFPGRNDATYGSLMGAVGASTLITLVSFLLLSPIVTNYNDHLRKGKVAKAVALLINLREPAEGYMAANNGKFPPNVGTYTASITSNPNEFYLEATISDEDNTLDGLTVRLIYDPDTESWRCSADHAYGIPQKYLPEVCKP